MQDESSTISIVFLETANSKILLTLIKVDFDVMVTCEELCAKDLSDK